MPKVDFNSLDHELIRRNFIESSFSFRWKDKYVIRCTMNDNGDARKRTTWPFVYGMSEWQSVTSAMWDIQGPDGKPILVAAWVFSPGGDETNLLHLESYASDAFEFHEAAKEEQTIPMPSCCEPDSVFSCSSGDCPVDDDDFKCPALAAFESVEELERDSTRKEEALAFQRAPNGRAPFYYEEDPNEYSADEEDEYDDNEDDNEDKDDHDGDTNVKGDAKNELVFDLLSPPKPTPPRELPPPTAAPGTVFVAPASFSWGSSSSVAENSEAEAKRQRLA